ncbi:hypothetical protein SNL23_09945 [Pseudomonas sp. SED1]|nr:hypothetical protein [Pseudomonas sp. SED1]
MIDLTAEVHLDKSEAVDLLGKIANANTRLQVFSCEWEVLAFMWRLETDDEVSYIDINNLRIVFSMASEKRLHELAFLKG